MLLDLLLLLLVLLHELLLLLWHWLLLCCGLLHRHLLLLEESWLGVGLREQVWVLLLLHMWVGHHLGLHVAMLRGCTGGHPGKAHQGANLRHWEGGGDGGQLLCVVWLCL